MEIHRTYSFSRNFSWSIWSRIYAFGCTRACTIGFIRRLPFSAWPLIWCSFCKLCGYVSFPFSVLQSKFSICNRKCQEHFEKQKSNLKLEILYSSLSGTDYQTPICHHSRNPAISESSQGPHSPHAFARDYLYFSPYWTQEGGHLRPY